MSNRQVIAGAPLYLCKSCEGNFPTDAFYASNQSTCKECVKSSVRANRAAKADYYRAYDRKRYRDDPERKARCQEMGRTTPMSERVRKQRERRRAEPHKNAARVAVYKAIKNGQLVRGDCYFCGSSERIQAHHEDYDHPLDVVWLCSSCHGKLHTIKGDFRRSS